MVPNVGWHGCSESSDVTMVAAGAMIDATTAQCERLFSPARSKSKFFTEPAVVRPRAEALPLPHVSLGRFGNEKPSSVAVAVV